MTVSAQLGTDSVMFSTTMTNSATQTANLDTRGADYATVRMVFGTEKNTNATGPTISLLEDNTTVVTNFATFDANFERTAEDLTTARSLTYHVDCRGRQRYLRLSITTIGTTNDDITVAAIGTLTRQDMAPTNASEMADAAVVG